LTVPARRIAIAVELHHGEIVRRARAPRDRQTLAGFAVYQHPEVSAGKRGVDRRGCEQRPRQQPGREEAAERQESVRVYFSFKSIWCRLFSKYGANAPTARLAHIRNESSMQ
jgi:hypothetical protein